MKTQYRGYTINANKLNRLFWVSKGHFGVCWADSIEDAKAKIDAILARKSA